VRAEMRVVVRTEKDVLNDVALANGAEKASHK
jgi:hypothetical protein